MPQMRTLCFTPSASEVISMVSPSETRTLPESSSIEGGGDGEEREEPPPPLLARPPALDGGAESCGATPLLSGAERTTDPGATKSAA